MVVSHCPALTELLIDCHAHDHQLDEPSSDEDDEAGTGETGEEGAGGGEGPAEAVAADGEEGTAAALLAGKAQGEGLDCCDMLTLGLDRLLGELGPRLLDLTIMAADSWLPGMFRALRHCRALTDLFVEAGDT